MDDYLKRIATYVESPRDLLIGRVACGATMVTVLLVTAFIGGWFAKRTSIGWGLALGLFMLCVLAGLYVAQLTYELEGWFEQHLRDLGAARLWSALQAGQPPPFPFTLYLRPFASTDNIGAQTERFVRMTAPGAGPTVLAMGSDRLEFEAEVEKAVRDIGPLVALGKPLEHMGAGRIRVGDHEWKHAVERLMDAAALIVLLPSSRPGTTWEVQTLLGEGRLIKTVVVDPPDELGAREKTYDPSSEWAEVRAAFSAYGFTLPPDDPEGLLLYFGTETAPIRKTKITMNGVGTVKTFVATVMKDIKANAPHAPTVRIRGV